PPSGPWALGSLTALVTLPRDTFAFARITGGWGPAAELASDLLHGSRSRPKRPGRLRSGTGSLLLAALVRGLPAQAGAGGLPLTATPRRTLPAALARADAPAPALSTYGGSPPAPLPRRPRSAATAGDRQCSAARAGRR